MSVAMVENAFAVREDRGEVRYAVGLLETTIESLDRALFGRIQMIMNSKHRD